jgi:hypothetical protein
MRHFFTDTLLRKLGIPPDSSSIGRYALLAIVALASGCVPQYRTVIPNEALFTTRPADKETLGKSGHSHTQKAITFRPISDTVYEPREDETYAQFKVRLHNNYQLQNYEQKELLKAISKTKLSIEDLKGQIGLLKDKYVNLRMEYADLTLEDRKDNVTFTLFQRYQIKPGDTLQNISKQTYRTYSGWLGIYRFNIDRLPNGPNRLHPGTWIVVPNINQEQSIRAHQARRTGP